MLWSLRPTKFEVVEEYWDFYKLTFTKHAKKPVQFQGDHPVIGLLEKKKQHFREKVTESGISIMYYPQ